MNLFQKTQINNSIAKELKDFGFHIQASRPKKHANKGDLIEYKGKACELLDLVEVTENRELWQVHFLDENEPAFIFL